ncbi:MAG TPA: amidase [Solirubrobacteraceae bacterium]|nr:amidase [Solirubrobacteraceae bacterium]
MDAPITIAEAAAGLRSRTYSAVELLASCTARADALDASLGVYIARFDEAATAAARAADRAFAVGEDRGQLQGVPIGVKDIIRTEEAATTGNTTVVNPAWEVCEDATVVARLREAGAVVTGKLTTMELAIGVPDETEPFPYPRNPWDTTRWAGGSSSGSASGVAAGMFLGALGSDTGGSIRLPATYCGITGHKPTFGLVPKDGVIPLGNSMDVVGPLARTAADARTLLGVIRGHAPADACSAPIAAGAPMPAPSSIDGLTLGVDRSHLDGDAVDPAFRDAFEAAVEQLAGHGLALVDVSSPMYDEVTAASIITWNSEAYAYHRRALREQPGRFGASARAVFMNGGLIGAGDYIQAQKVRRLGRERVARLFDEVDLIIGPTATGVAPRVEGLDFAQVAASVYTNYWSGLGNPAVNIPIGFSAEGLPFGCQLAAPAFADALLLDVAELYQRDTDFHLRRPASLGREPLDATR